jgi:hypothetical protein
MATVSSQWLGTSKMIDDFATSLEIIKVRK